jgi:hypothetical protein
MNRTITMSIKELDRLKIIQKCIDKKLSQENGAKQRNVRYTSSQINTKFSFKKTVDLRWV